MSIDKFMKAIEDVTSFIGANNDGDHWGTITWDELDPTIDQKRSGNERSDEYPYNTEFGDGKTKEEMLKIDLDNRDREVKINETKKVFKKLDPKLQEAVKFLINDIQVKRIINTKKII